MVCDAPTGRTRGLEEIEIEQKRKREIQDDAKTLICRPLGSDHRTWFFPVMCNIARQGRIQMGSCSGSRAVQQSTEERNGVMSQKARLLWLPGLSQQHRELKRAPVERAREGPRAPRVK